jgi:spectinomycin phosphotransferase
VQERPPDLADDAVHRCLRQGWSIDAAVAYAAVGFGSHHWVATAGDERWFVTVDDLLGKPMLGDGAGVVYGSLSLMHLTARDLRDDGLEFVVAPLLLHHSWSPAADMCTVNLENRWAMSVSPYVEGTTWGFSDTLPDAQRNELVELLARLHAAEVPDIEQRIELPPSGRDALVALLDSEDGEWSAGPLSAAAASWLVEHRELVHERLAQIDRIAAGIPARDLVVTHGEPHAGNLIGTTDGLRLVDWDTVALAPRERDLWLVGTDEATVAAYEDASGIRVDRRRLAAYRLAWDLADVASFLDELRRPHDDNADTRAALRYLQGLELTPLDN